MRSGCRCCGHEADVANYDGDVMLPTAGDTLLLTCGIRRAIADADATDDDGKSGDDADVTADLLPKALLPSECSDARVTLLTDAGSEH